MFVCRKVKERKLHNVSSRSIELQLKDQLSELPFQFTRFSSIRPTKLDLHCIDSGSVAMCDDGVETRLDNMRCINSSSRQYM